ncbi:MAG: TonB-dependent siderophore receptor [Methylotetracoccus sp.]
MRFWVKPITAAVVMAMTCPAFAEGEQQTADASADSKNASRGKKPAASPNPAATEPTTLPALTVTATATATPEEPDPQDPRYYVPTSGTALRTDTPIMETPLSIQVVPKQVVKDQQVFTVERAMDNVSNVYQNNTTFLGSADEFNIRGFATGGILYRDGMRFSTGGFGKRDPANLEQFEVMKGPASILYGRIEPGGLINLVTKKPLSTPYYDLTQQFGSYGFYRTTMDATGSITDDNQFGYRFNGAYENAGSFRQFLKNESYFVAPVATWNISPDTQLRIGLDTLQENQHPDSVGQVAICVSRDKNGKCVRRPAPGLNPTNLGENFSTLSSTTNTISQSLTHILDDNWQIREQFTSFIGDSTNNVVYGDAGPVFDRKTKTWVLPRTLGGVDNNAINNYMGSLNLVGKFDGLGMKHQALFGGDYYYETTKETYFGGSYNYKINAKGRVTNQPCETIDSIDLYDAQHSGSKSTRALGCTISKYGSRTSWYGLYFQDQMDLNTYGLHLLGGLRYDNALQNTNDQLAPPPFVGVNDVHNYRVNPRGGILWNPVDWFTAYGSYVTGFGQVNQGITAQGKALDPEIAAQWETGIKTEFMEGRFNATVAFFEITKSNIAGIDPNDFRFSVLVGTARSRGVEIDLAGEILPGWRVLANYAYTEARIVDGGEAIARALAPVGNKVPNVPRNGGRVWTTYEMPVGDSQSVSFGGGMTARGQREGNYQNNYQIPGFVTMDLMAAYSFKVGGKQMSAQLNVDNLLDRGYIVAGTDFFRNRMAVGAPRTFLGMIRMEF